MSGVPVKGCEPPDSLVSFCFYFLHLPPSPPYVSVLPLKKMSLNYVYSLCQAEGTVTAHERFQLQVLKPAQCFSSVSLPPLLPLTD